MSVKKNCLVAIIPPPLVMHNSCVFLSNLYFTQIAGLVARRIKCDLNIDQSVKVGEKFGIIRFGSRVDLYVPADFEVEVLKGQTVIGGETKVASLKKQKSPKNI